jgi:hypothetical protein
MEQKIDVYELFNQIEAMKHEMAKLDGEVTALEDGKNIVKAIMMKKSNEQSLGAQEREANASEEYQRHCQKRDEAVARRSLLKTEYALIQMKFEAWRSMQATNRALDRMTQ